MLRASHDGYLGLRIAGACYLISLGARSLRSSGAQSLEPAAGPRKLRTGYPAGLLTDLLNPKVGVFFVTFLPGFIPYGEPVGYVSLLLGAIFIVLTGIYFVLLLAAAGSRCCGGSRPRTSDGGSTDGTGLVLIGFGLRLALEP